MTTFFYLFGSCLFVATLCKQFLLIIESPKGDDLIVSKVLFFIFNILVLTFTWLIRYDHDDFAGPFFIAAGAIGVWTYYTNKIHK